jgi:hypothetical protein
MARHPIDKILAEMSERDRRIAEKMLEAGFGDEDLYAALPNPKADALLREKQKCKAVTTPCTKC